MLKKALKKKVYICENTGIDTNNVGALPIGEGKIRNPYE